MPLLFSLAIHDSLVEANRGMQPGEHLFAFLDDVYVVSPPGRTRPMYNALGEKMEAGAGIRLHAGKTKVWNRASMCPPDVVDLGAEVWNPEGIKILGTPVGSLCAAKGHRASGRGTQTLGSYPTRPGLAMCVADPSSMRRAAVPPCVACFATNPVKGVCRGA